MFITLPNQSSSVVCCEGPIKWQDYFMDVLRILPGMKMVEEAILFRINSELN